MTTEKRHAHVALRQINKVAAGTDDNLEIHVPRADAEKDTVATNALLSAFGCSVVNETEDGDWKVLATDMPYDCYDDVEKAVSLGS